MSTGFWRSVVGWTAVAAVGGGLLFWFGVPIVPSVPGGDLLKSGAPSVVSTKTEGDVLVAALSDGSHAVSAPAGGYALKVPAGWYMEWVASSGVTVYPDYSPASSSYEPLCKIEFYVSPNQSGTPLEEWVGKKLHEDPTEDIVQTSMEAMTVDGWPAIRWTGTADIYPMINTYVAVGARIFEIVPVTASGDSLSVAPCMDGVNAFVSSLKLIP